MIVSLLSLRLGERGGEEEEFFFFDEELLLKAAGLQPGHCGVIEWGAGGPRLLHHPLSTFR